MMENTSCTQGSPASLAALTRRSSRTSLRRYPSNARTPRTAYPAQTCSPPGGLVVSKEISFRVTAIGSSQLLICSSPGTNPGQGCCPRPLFPALALRFSARGREARERSRVYSCSAMPAGRPKRYSAGALCCPVPPACCPGENARTGRGGAGYSSASADDWPWRWSEYRRTQQGVGSDPRSDGTWVRQAPGRERSPPPAAGSQESPARSAPPGELHR
jgi:hypothetical protein